MLKQIKDSIKLADIKMRYPNANAVVIILAIVMLWRGAWGLLDTFLFPGSPAFSYLICIALGAIILYLDDFRIDNLKR
jgi:hypothetical protein